MTESRSEQIKRFHAEHRARNQKSLDIANQEIVPADLLTEIIRKFSALPQVTDSAERWNLRYDCLAKILKNRGLENTHAFFGAIHNRVTALENLPAEALYGWSPVNGSASEFPHAEVIQAAATEPLILDSSTFPLEIFDQRSFHQRLLQIAEELRKK